MQTNSNITKYTTFRAYRPDGTHLFDGKIAREPECAVLLSESTCAEGMTPERVRHFFDLDGAITVSLLDVVDASAGSAGEIENPVMSLTIFDPHEVIKHLVPFHRGARGGSNG